MTHLILNPQPTVDTPATVDNYPYGFTLRTLARYWTETKKGTGQRVVFQTKNPRCDKWNKPKPSTYSDIVILYRNTENNHIESDGLSFAYSGQKELDAFLAKYPIETLTTYQQQAIAYFKGIIYARQFIKITIHEGTRITEEQKQQDAKEAQIMKDVRAICLEKTAEELNKLPCRRSP